ncbi:phosphonate C-P lyase system protein PhnH [Cryptosporangium phraense]|uniref:Phosphonate C-P lyase system protein PhnH n=1 Tax=Cryptosporangium phraense TaxID=2593070 RepID=A0A545AL78_9ACTN|nr:phosphonate C-P lyase system protein PhnH [Cryptosporangium phraense]TQS42067.1 phosphonate C-P lyase system protein PhnH [Cryptosporangium phraense]
MSFTDPTRDAQRAFRAVLDALAHPTRPFPITGPDRPPAPLGRAAAAVGLTLCDDDTPVWIDPVLAADGAVAAWFAFHTGAPVLSGPAEAAFVFATGFDALPPLTALAAGTPEQPHTSATIVLETTGRNGREYRATGPGIDGEAGLVAPAAFGEFWRQNTERFPLGVDLLLVEGDRVRGLPRTTTLEGVS